MSNITNDQWEKMSLDECRKHAELLVRDLPTGFALRDAVRHIFDSREFNVVTFHYADTTFALIPGGIVNLGFDPNHLWEPTEEELESWQETAEEYGVEIPLREQIDVATLKPRSVELGSMLVEVSPQELGWNRVHPDDPTVREVIRGNLKYMKGAAMEIQGDGSSIRVRRNGIGEISAEYCVHSTQAQLAEGLLESGFRFPTSDEWEYVCGGGAETLFRWGDHAPCNRYPTDEPGTDGWNLHQLQNAFGLYVASDPYKSELVAELGITRGGDGGMSICGGAGFFVGWLPLATAYFEEHSCRRPADELINPEFIVGRRVLSLV